MKRLKLPSFATSRILARPLVRPALYRLRLPSDGQHRHLSPGAWRCCSSHGAEPADIPRAAATTTTTIADTTTPAGLETNSKKPIERALSGKHALYGLKPESPGSPVLYVNGTRIFNRLVEFLRAQYTLYGYQEVNTPLMYKNALWRQSGHLENFADDMFQIVNRKERHALGRAMDEDERFSLKPMNCPGHCLVYQTMNPGWRELPLRLAEFAPLHRDEVPSALTGLTRVRRFHQDDAHIFCRPEQIQEEVTATLAMLDTVYAVFGMTDYKFLLSTRPESKYVGTEEEWARAEDALKGCLAATGREWTVNAGDGAFYGPKIDVILKDAKGRYHQTATVQLDFQLPRKFELVYKTPQVGSHSSKDGKAATEVEEQAEQAEQEIEGRNEKIEEERIEEKVEGEIEGKAKSQYENLLEQGFEVPVIVHRALFGSLERFMALLIERYGVRWPFWLSPHQAVVIPTSGKPEVLAFAQQSLGARTFYVDVMDSEQKGLRKKLALAKTSGAYNVVVVLGPAEARDGLLKYEVYREGKYVQAEERLTPAELYARFMEMEREFQ
ncbi:hypothetical protein DRE_01530 [Drechslerella stenobrocha 248]|uniref:threonine--tRNA ligase n=1 Tax=Drechslerella stenobrocha 248 TaxID=1043628 RepID=W7HUY1_9PEZI|nr:hypothetical protein DRE_01530 [Drechslerella stenobrocha 248]